MGFIYGITCSVTGKLYIGQTTQIIEARMKKHIYSANAYKRYLENPNAYPNWKGTCTKLYRAMLKHGYDKFIIEIIEECDNDDLDSTEIMYIAEFDVVKNGYNLKEGGDSSHHSEETKKIIGERTRQAMERNISKFKTYEIVKDLPMYCVRVNIKGSEGVAINRHPLCKRKSFTIKEYGSMENAKEELRKFLAELEINGKPYVVPKVGQNLRKGIRAIKGGYAVQKIHKKVLHYKSFTRAVSDDENRRLAELHLDQLLESWKHDK